MVPLSATMRRSMPRASALKSPALTAPPPMSSCPTPRGAIMSAAERNGTNSTASPCSAKYPLSTGTKNPASLTEATTPTRRVLGGAWACAAPARKKTPTTIALPDLHQHITPSSPPRLQPQQLHGVLAQDPPLCLRRSRHLINRAQRLADIPGSALGIERHVAAKQDVLGAEERQPALKGRRRSVQGGVGVEHPIVVVRVLPQGAQQRSVVLVRGAGAELIVSILDPGFQERHSAAQMVRDDLQCREAVQEPAENHPRHRDRRIEGPSKDMPDLIE